MYFAPPAGPVSLRKKVFFLFSKHTSLGTRSCLCVFVFSFGSDCVNDDFFSVLDLNLDWLEASPCLSSFGYQ